jgi:hypothetical protein
LQPNSESDDATFAGARIDIARALCPTPEFGEITGFRVL